eukprot:COSAG04_NODE_588_length_12325_cov_114.087682_3_plen_228_part_00
MPAYHSFVVAGVVGRPDMETTRAARRLESLPAWLFEQPLRALLIDTCASLSELPSAFQHCATLRILDCASTPLGLEMETGYSLELIEGMESRFLPLHAIAPGLRIRIEDTDQYTNNLEAVGFVGGWWDPGVFDLRRHLEAQEQAQREFEEAKAAAAALPQPPPVPTPGNIYVNLGFLARRFSTVTDRFSGSWCRFPESCSQNGANGEKTGKKRAKTGEKWPKESGVS